MLLHAIEKVEENDCTYLAAAYCAFASGDREAAGRAAAAIRGLLEQYSMQKLIRLSEQFREYTSLEWSIDWTQINLKSMRAMFASLEDYRYSLILGSFHPNGYFRESCVQNMAELPDMLPCLILRMNDWVQPIRDKLPQIISDRIASCPIEEILVSAQALDKVKQSERRDHIRLTAIEEQMAVRIEKDISNVSIYRITQYEFGIRKNIYKILFAFKILEFEQARKLLDMEKHSFCNTLIIKGILKHYSCTLSVVDTFLHSKHASVRYKALEYRYALEKNNWSGLEVLLLDSNRSVRELTAFILRRHTDFSIPDFYIQHLQDENPVMAIAGMGEHQIKDAADLLLPFLGNPRDSVIKQTLLTLGKLEDYDGQAVFWNYLLDYRVSVSKASYLSIVKRQIRYGAKTLYHTCQITFQEHVKQYAVKLLLRESSWERLPYLLELYQDETLSELHDKILGRISVRNMFEKVGREQRNRIEDTLKRCQGRLSEKLVSDIRFDLKFVAK